MSDCPLNGPVADLLLPLRASGHLARMVARRANLSGHLPDIACLREGRVDGVLYSSYCGLPLSTSLQTLDLSGNKITAVDALNVQASVSLADNQRMAFAKGILEDALKHNLQLELTGTDVTHLEGISRLVVTGALNMTAQPTTINATGGYGCHDVASSSLKVSPHLFFPEGLCACLEGYQGQGTQCRQCTPGFFSEAFNSTCRPCPGNSTSPRGAISVDSCQCDVGRTDPCLTQSRST